jgi:tryptophan synthase alpha chain
VGFGLSSREQIIEVKDYCEGVIVGSALMRRVMENGIDDCVSFMADIRNALSQ